VELRKKLADKEAELRARTTTNSGQYLGAQRRSCTPEALGISASLPVPTTNTAAAAATTAATTTTPSAATTTTRLPTLASTPPTANTINNTSNSYTDHQHPQQHTPLSSHQPHTPSSSSYWS
jgi:hypothetical protein